MINLYILLVPQNFFCNALVQFEGNVNNFLLVTVHLTGMYLKIGTISFWLKRVMFAADINTSMFEAHCARCACTSKKLIICIPVNHILKLAGWTYVPSFGKYYDNIVLFFFCNY